jgi:RimJ/RimL family protein N-acetyltransferase
MARHKLQRGRRAWVVRREGNSDRLGVVTLRGTADRLTISISLIAAVRGQGLGPTVIRLACAEAVEGWGETVRVVAHIKRDNPGSLAAFRKAGFRDSPAVHRDSSAMGIEELQWTPR